MRCDVRGAMCEVCRVMRDAWSHLKRNSRGRRLFVLRLVSQLQQLLLLPCADLHLIQHQVELRKVAGHRRLVCVKQAQRAIRNLSEPAAEREGGIEFDGVAHVYVS